MTQGIPDRGPALTHAMIALIVLCDVSVLLRFVSRRIARAGFASDDYLAVIAMVRSCYLVYLFIFGENHELTIGVIQLAASKWKCYLRPRR